MAKVRVWGRVERGEVLPGWLDGAAASAWQRCVAQGKWGHVASSNGTREEWFGSARGRTVVLDWGHGAWWSKWPAPAYGCAGRHSALRREVEDVGRGISVIREISMDLNVN